MINFDKEISWGIWEFYLAMEAVVKGRNEAASPRDSAKNPKKRRRA